MQNNKMKQNNLFKTVLLAVALLAGSSIAWADPEATLSIPQELGSYILIGQDQKGKNGLTADGVTLTGCKVDGDGTCYTVGSTNGSPVTIQFAFTAETGNYLFSFKSGHKEGTSELSLSLKNSSNSEIWNNGGNNVAIAKSGSWTPVDLHAFNIGNLEAGETYTMTITGVSKTGSSYYGNFGNFSFHKSTQYASSWNNTENIIFTDAYNTGNSISTDWINSITVDSYVEFYTYTPSDGYYYVQEERGSRYGSLYEGIRVHSGTVAVFGRRHLAHLYAECRRRPVETVLFRRQKRVHPPSVPRP